MTKRRFRIPTAKNGELLAQYGSDHGDIDLHYCWPDNEVGMKADSRLLMFAIERAHVHDGKTLRTLLQERWYDITTFKLTVKKVKP
jgi:hypothetical protein